MLFILNSGINRSILEANEQRPINDFRSVMEAVLKAVREKKFGQAAILASLAHNLAPNLSEQARAARDLSAAYRHQGDYDESEKWATEAVEQHEALVEEGENRSTLRELGASVVTLGTLQLQRIATDPSYDNQENSQRAAENLSKGLRYIEESREYTTNKNSKIDQYDINFTARTSFAEALAGNTKRSLALGARAVWLAFWSESPKIDTSNPKLSITERFKAKARASVRGVGTVAVAAVAPFNREFAKSIVKKLN